MNQRSSLLLLAVVVLLYGCERPQHAWFCPQQTYPIVDNPPAFPEAGWEQLADSGWDQEGLAEAFELADELDMGAIMLVDDGRLVSSWGCTHEEWYIASTRKSFMGAIMGILWERGSLDLDATLGDLEITDHSPPLTAGQRQVRLKHVMTSSSGICHASAAGMYDCAENPPGEVFQYNNWDFNVLNTVVQRVSGQSYGEILDQHIGMPIGMEDFTFEDVDYATIEESEHAAYVTFMSARDMARFGLLALNEGRWKQQQIVSSAWLSLSSRPHASTGEANPFSNYGYLWWVHKPAMSDLLGVAPGSFSAEGNWMQGIFVFPTERIVLVVRGNIALQWLFGGPKRDEMMSLLSMLLAARPRSA